MCSAGIAAEMLIGSFYKRLEKAKEKLGFDNW